MKELFSHKNMLTLTLINICLQILFYCGLLSLDMFIPNMVIFCSIVAVYVALHANPIILIINSIAVIGGILYYVWM